MGEPRPGLALLSHQTLVLVADELLTLATRHKEDADRLREAIGEARHAIGGDHPGSTQADFDLDRSLSPLWEAAGMSANGRSRDQSEESPNP